MAKTEVMRVNAKHEKIELSLPDLDNFEVLGNRRDIRKSVVSRLHGVLDRGQHFETPIMVNKKNGKLRLLDGNHRIEAIRRYLTRNPDAKVEIVVFSYDNLTPEEERKMYTKWNLGTKQTTNDFVKQYWDTMRITKLIDKDEAMPCKVSHVWGTRTIEFKLLFGGYLACLTKNFYGGLGGPAMDFIEQAKKLDESDLKYVKAFMKDYIEVFGVPNKKNMHYKKAVFTAAMRIWMDNHKTVGFSVMRNAFVKLRGHPEVVRYSALGGGRDAIVQCRVDLLRVINGNRKQNLFV